MKQINILPSEGLQSPPLSTVSMMFSYDSKPNEDKRDKKKIHGSQQPTNIDAITSLV